MQKSPHWVAHANLCASLEFIDLDYLFAAKNVGYHHSLSHINLWEKATYGKVVRYGHSKSLKLAPIESLYAISC